MKTDHTFGLVATLAAWRSMLKPFSGEINCETSNAGVTLTTINGAETNSIIVFTPLGTASLRGEGEVWNTRLAFRKDQFLEWAALVAKQTPKGNPSTAAEIAFRVRKRDQRRRPGFRGLRPVDVTTMKIADANGSMSVGLPAVEVMAQEETDKIQGVHEKARNDPEMESAQVASIKVNGLLRLKSWKETLFNSNTRDKGTCKLTMDNLGLSFFGKMKAGESISAVYPQDLASLRRIGKPKWEHIMGGRTLTTRISPALLAPSARYATGARKRNSTTTLRFGNDTPVLVKWTNRFDTEFESLIAPQIMHEESPQDEDLPPRPSEAQGDDFPREMYD